MSETMIAVLVAAGVAAATSGIKNQCRKLLRQSDNTLRG